MVKVCLTFLNRSVPLLPYLLPPHLNKYCVELCHWSGNLCKVKLVSNLHHYNFLSVTKKNNNNTNTSSFLFLSNTHRSRFLIVIDILIYRFGPLIMTPTLLLPSEYDLMLRAKRIIIITSVARYYNNLLLNNVGSCSSGSLAYCIASS